MVFLVLFLDFVVGPPVQHHHHHHHHHHRLNARTGFVEVVTLRRDLHRHWLIFPALIISVLLLACPVTT